MPSKPTTSTATLVAASSISPAQISILPYTEGLTGVNLWLNDITSGTLYSSLGLIVLLVLLVRLAQVTQAHVRLLATLSRNGEQQRYWTYNGPLSSKIKKNFLVAPLIHKRHSKEIRLSAASNVGTLPSRLHTLFLSFYLLSNFLYCSLLDYWHQPNSALLAEARGRTGHLAVMNMLPLFIFAARNNPFIQLLGVSFDTFNLFHRWIGRIVVLESIAHTFLWGANNYNARGLDGLIDHLVADPFLVYGLMSFCAMLAILVQSVSVIRHAFYETFLHLHQILGAAAVIGIILHCEIQELPQRPFLYVLMSVWGLERFVRLCRILHRRGTTVQVEALEGGACRLTFNIRGSWTKAPGHHIYAYIPALSLWMSHPFSVAWVDTDCGAIAGSEPIFTSSFNTTPEPEYKSSPKRWRTTLSCVVACRTGMTASLYRRARKSSTGFISLKAFLEGPYGGLESMRSYGTVMLFAGGVGITHQISHVRDLARGVLDGTCSTRKVVLVWSVRSIEQLEWARPWLEEVMNMPRHGCSLQIILYVTRSTANRTQDGSMMKVAGFTEDVRFGRLKPAELVLQVFRERVGAMSVGVCGPGALADDVRAATRAVMDLGNVDFWEEAFTW